MFPQGMQLYFSSSDSLDRAEVDRYRLQADTDSLYDFMLVSAVNIVCIPSFVEITVDGESKTGMKITIQEEK